ncbi:hypothetical protein [Corynebacterium aurimucosum]
MAIDWNSHKLHRAQVAEDEGAYIGLLNENGQPLMDCPPVINMTAPQTKNAAVSLRMQMAVKALDGTIHPICDELIARGLSRQGGQWLDVDAEGKLLATSLDATRFIIIEREASARRTYQVTHTVAEGGEEAPSIIEVNGFNLLKKLALIPCFSAPTTVTGKWTTFTRDWAGPENVGVMFSKPRDLQDFKLVTVADGVTVDGPAEDVIRRIITESLAAAWKAIGPETEADPPMVVDPTPTGITSPYILLRPTDGALLDEVAGPAASAGVSITADMWLPGDKAVAGHNLTKPTIVVRVAQTTEVK